MKSVWVFGIIVAAFVIYMVFVKRQENFEAHEEVKAELIPPPDLKNAYGETQDEQLYDEDMSMGIGPGTFGFGRYGNSFMA